MRLSQQVASHPQLPWLGHLSAEFQGLEAEDRCWELLTSLDLQLLHEGPLVLWVTSHQSTIPNFQFQAPVLGALASQCGSQHS